MKTIKITCGHEKLVALKDIHVLQEGTDFLLKDLTEKRFNELRKSIEKNGFQMPFFIWHCDQDKKTYFIDGTQRYKVLQSMIDSGDYNMPEKYPAVSIHLKNKKQAAMAILYQSSHYGEPTPDGLYAFLNAFDLANEFREVGSDIHMYGIDSDEFINNWMKENELTDYGDDQPGISMSDEKYDIIVECISRSDQKKTLSNLIKYGYHCHIAEE